MSKITLGVIKEGKVPPDFRVPLSPKRCKSIKEKYTNVEILVQSSDIRCFSDDEYRNEGIQVVDDLSDCDIILGVKEVPINMLIPGKKFMFFSHTIKKQPYNRQLLQAILDKKIQLIDYEVIKNKIGKRLVGFGRYAGIVGCYNGVRAFGIKNSLYAIKPAHQCFDRKELEEELKKVSFPKNTKIVLTGFGRVGYGAREIMNLLPIIEVTPEEYLNQEFNEAVFTHIDMDEYFARKSDRGFDKQEFYANPELYQSVFNDFASISDMYVACHFWSSKSPFILTKEDLKSNKSLSVVADISCDIDGPVACTIRPTKIADPFFAYDKESGKEVTLDAPNSIMVMAVDNLPCELPKDASEDFGNDLFTNVFPFLFGEDPDKIIERASETNSNGTLNANFAYLQDYVDGVGVS